MNILVIQIVQSALSHKKYIVIGSHNLIACQNRALVSSLKVRLLHKHF
jgi:hypothetical protein